MQFQTRTEIGRFGHLDIFCGKVAISTPSQPLAVALYHFRFTLGDDEGEFKFIDCNEEEAVITITPENLSSGNAIGMEHSSFDYLISVIINATLFLLDKFTDEQEDTVICGSYEILDPQMKQHFLDTINYSKEQRWLF